MNCSSKLQFCCEEKSPPEPGGRGLVGREIEEGLTPNGDTGGGDLRGEVRYSLRKASRPARPREGGSLASRLPDFSLSSRSISSRSSRSCAELYSVEMEKEISCLKHSRLGYY